MFFTSYTPPNYTVSQDPMAASYMSRGGMEYLPQAQFMTPSEYGAFRTPSPQSNGMNVIQQQSLLQAYLIQSRGRIPGFASPYMLGAYDPSSSQHAQTVMASRRVQDAMAVAKGTLADTALQMAPMFVPGVGMIAGAAMGMAMPRLNQYRNDYFREARKTQMMTFPSVMAGADVSASYGQGFSMRAATGLEHDIRRDASQDSIFSEKDYKRLMQMGIKSGMFDYSSSAQQYKTALKTLVSNYKTFLDVVEEADIFPMMQRLQRMGVKQSAMGGMIRTESMFARMIGVSHQDMINTYGQQGALSYAQNGMTGYTGTLAAVSSAASLSLSRNLGLISPGMLSRLGGIEGGTQKLTDLKTTVDSSIAKALLPALLTKDLKSLDTAKIEKLKSGALDITSLVQESGAALQGKSPSEYAAYMTRSSKLMEQLQNSQGDDGMDAIRMNLLASIGRMGEPGLSYAAAALKGGISENIAPEVVEEYVRHNTDPKILEGRARQAAIEVRKAGTERTNRALDRASWKNRPWREVLDIWSGVLEYTGFKTSTEQEAFERDLEEARKTGTLGLLDFAPGASGFGALSAQQQAEYFKNSHLGGAAFNGMSPTGTDGSQKYKNLSTIVNKQAGQREQWEAEARGVVNAYGLDWDKVHQFLKDAAGSKIKSADDLTQVNVFKALQEALRGAIADSNKTSGSSQSHGEIASLARKIAVELKGTGGSASLVFDSASIQNPGLWSSVTNEYNEGRARLVERDNQAAKRRKKEKYISAVTSVGGGAADWYSLGYDTPDSLAEELQYAHEYILSAGLDSDSLASGATAVGNFGLSRRDVQVMTESAFSSKAPTKDSLRVALIGALQRSNPGLGQAELNTKADAILADDAARMYLLNEAGQSAGPDTINQVMYNYSSQLSAVDSFFAGDLNSRRESIVKKFNSVIDSGSLAADDRHAVEDAANTDVRAYDLASMQMLFSSLLNNDNAPQSEKDRVNEKLEGIRKRLGLSPEDMQKFMDKGQLSGISDVLVEKTNLSYEQIGSLSKAMRRVGRGKTLTNAGLSAETLYEVAGESYSLMASESRNRVQNELGSQMSYSDFLDPKKRAQRLDNSSSLTSGAVKLLNAAQSLDPNGQLSETVLLANLKHAVAGETPTDAAARDDAELKVMQDLQTTLDNLNTTLRNSNTILEQQERGWTLRIPSIGTGTGKGD